MSAAKSAPVAHSTGPFAKRSAGVLLPVASLPGRFGVGDLGPGLEAFLDWCGQAGLGWWQILPVGPVGAGNSPYATRSAFAGEPLFLALERLVEQGLLKESELRAAERGKTKELRSAKANYSLARRIKFPLLARAHDRWREGGGHRRAAYRRWVQGRAEWLEGWLDHEEDLGREVGAFAQFCFARQWREIRRSARSKGVRILGDLPIFVGADSSDVAARPDLFRLDRKGAPEVVTGSPPDGFSADGQVWGHPHYRWRAHAKEDYAWWRARFQAELDRCDALRVDHFIGFHHAWEVPAKDGHARNGRWGRTPGRAILDAVSSDGGGLPLVAEDLGVVTPPVRALRDRYGLPGMRILQFAFGESDYDRPFRYPENAVVYTGTHDNNTTAGWWRSLDGAARNRARSLLGLPKRGVDPSGVARHMVAALFASPANTAIVPLQDLLGLPASARINLPGTPSGNWGWRVEERALSATLASRVRDMVEVSGRRLR